jgi:hypothetical protein
VVDEVDGFIKRVDVTALDCGKQRRSGLAIVRALRSDGRLEFCRGQPLCDDIVWHCGRISTFLGWIKKPNGEVNRLARRT